MLFPCLDNIYSIELFYLQIYSAVRFIIIRFDSRFDIFDHGFDLFSFSFLFAMLLYCICININILQLLSLFKTVSKCTHLKEYYVINCMNKKF